MKTTMRLAFEALPVAVLSTPLGKRVFRCLEGGAGVGRPDRKGWSTNLSYRTYTQLKKQGVVA